MQLYMNIHVGKIHVPQIKINKYFKNEKLMFILDAEGIR